MRTSKRPRHPHRPRRLRKHEIAAAYHEAAHAVASVMLRTKFAEPEPRERDFHIKAEAIGDAGKHVERRHLADARIVVLFAGRAVGKRVKGRTPFGWNEKDAQLARVLAAAVGIVGPEADAYLRWLELHTANRVDGWWAHIDAVAHSLLQRGRVSSVEVRKLMAAIGPAPVTSVLHPRRRGGEE